MRTFIRDILKNGKDKTHALIIVNAKQLLRLGYICCALIILTCVPTNGECVETAKEVESYCKYKTSYGLSIISYSNEWNTPLKLKTIGDELIKNKTGEELSHLKYVYIYGNANSGVRGYYTANVSELGENYYMGNTYIELFDCDTYNHVNELAFTLSHEYGHHFNAYHILRTENKVYKDWKTSLYATIRNLEDYPNVQYDENKINSHSWDVAEIAAADYVQIMGSPLAKQSEIYKDIAILLNDNISEYKKYVRFNMYPQENLDIPLATEVSGLTAYFNFLAGTKFVEPKHPGNLEISVEPSLFLSPEYVQYKISFTPLDDDYEYTIIMYPKGQLKKLNAIKTCISPSDCFAYFGTMITTSPDGRVYGFFDKYEGDYVFKIYIKDKNNYVYASAPYYYTFQ